MMSHDVTWGHNDVTWGHMMLQYLKSSSSRVFFAGAWEQGWNETRVPIILRILACILVGVDL